MHDLFAVRGAKFSGRLEDPAVQILVGDSGMSFAQPTELWRAHRKKVFEECGSKAALARNEGISELEATDLIRGLIRDGEGGAKKVNPDLYFKR